MSRYASPSRSGESRIPVPSPTKSTSLGCGAPTIGTPVSRIATTAAPGPFVSRGKGSVGATTGRAVLERPKRIGSPTTGAEPHGVGPEAEPNRIGSATTPPIHSTVFGASVPSPSSALTRRTSAITSTDAIEADPQVSGSASLGQVGVVDSDLGARQLADGLDQLAHRRPRPVARIASPGRWSTGPFGVSAVLTRPSAHDGRVAGSDGSAMVVSL